MKNTGSTSGFTMIEMVIAITIGSILVGIALTTFQGVQNRFAVRNAKAMYATFHQRARSRSVESGETILFAVDIAGDSAYIWQASQGGAIDVVRFRQQMNVDLQATSSYVLCFTPRGYADYNCGMYAGLLTATTNVNQTLRFHMNADVDSVGVLPLGQLVGM